MEIAGPYHQLYASEREKMSLALEKWNMWGEESPKGSYLGGGKAS